MNTKNIILISGALALVYYLYKNNMLGNLFGTNPPVSDVYEGTNIPVVVPPVNSGVPIINPVSSPSYYTQPAPNFAGDLSQNTVDYARKMGFFINPGSAKSIANWQGATVTFGNNVFTTEPDGSHTLLL